VDDIGNRGLPHVLFVVGNHHVLQELDGKCFFLVSHQHLVVLLCFFCFVCACFDSLVQICLQAFVLLLVVLVVVVDEQIDLLRFIAGVLAFKEGKYYVFVIVYIFLHHVLSVLVTELKLDRS